MAEISVGSGLSFAGAHLAGGSAATGTAAGTETGLLEIVLAAVAGEGAAPWMRVRGARRRALDETLKRASDLVGATLILIALSPLLVAVAIAVKATSRGPVFFRQPRHGRDGRVFRIFKFRTMRGAPRSAATIGDPADHEARITPVGEVLRRYCIDELPQLLNVLTGDMSLVGPRAHPVGLHVLGTPYEEVVPAYHRRHAVRPGMTGLAQVVGYRGIVDSVEHARMRVANDIIYIGARGLRLDLALIAYTAWRFLMRGGRGSQPFPLHWFVPAGRAPDAA